MIAGIQFQGEREKDLVDQQIKELLDRGAKPIENPALALGYGLFGAQMWTLRSKQKLARGEKLDYGEKTDDKQT